MSEQTEVWNDLIGFLKPVLEIPVTGKNRLTRETDLYHDLDLEPNSIETLLYLWASRFDVDITDFQIWHYYPEIKLTRKQLFMTLVKAIFSKSFRQTLGGWGITLGMLEDAMLLGRWRS